MNNNGLSLIFTMALDSNPSLNYGRLVLIHEARGVIQRWIATSGLGAWQKFGGWSKQGGGCIPPTYQLRTPIPYYEVECAAVDLRHVKGVESDGYCIKPFEVVTKDGVTRSDLLIHRDANSPGSLGCVVLPDAEWWDFVKIWNRETKGCDRLPLTVIYT
jgi:hypothetical protein